METLFTSESVSEAHPDKLADQISDAVLDGFLKQDPKSRVACEVLLNNKKIVICGEVDSKAEIPTESLAKEVIKKVGYDSIEKGLDYNNCSIECYLNSQSENIRSAVGSGEKQGAGDQGIMFGYAVDETSVAMPLSIYLAHKLLKELSDFRKKPGYEFLWPDSKSQVTVRYEGEQIKDIATVLISSQHEPSCSLKKLKEFIHEELIPKSLVAKYLSPKTQIIVNPGGNFHIGGPQGDCGLTGRKIIVDTYGGHGAHGGGAFSGKDPSKVDRSGAYIARQIAKSFVKAGLMKKCLIQISYAIGRSQPISLWLNDFNSSKLSHKELKERVLKNWDLSPSAIIKSLDLLKRNYQDTACYGHFGREEENFTWEKSKPLL